MIEIIVILIIILWLYLRPLQNNDSIKSGAGVGVNDFALTSQVKHINTAINADLDKRVNYIEFNKICKYGTSGGKRVRAIIIDSIIKSLDSSKNSPDDLDDPNGQNGQNGSLHAMLFIEYLHASSLIMDDIMDKDLYRRGKQCLYKKYGTTIAELTSVYLMSIAMTHLCKFVVRHKCLPVLTIICDRLEKLCIGQYIDINATVENIDELIELKTGTLFEMSYVLVWIGSGGSLNQIDEIRSLGKHFGMLFQMADDFDDIEKDSINNPLCLQLGGMN